MISHLLVTALTWASPLTPPDTSPVAVALRSALESRGSVGMSADSDRVRAVLALAYARQGWQPFWLDRGRLTPAGARVLAGMAGALDRGLEPADYDAASLILDIGPKASGPPAEVAALDLAISAAALRFTRDLAHGRVDPRRWYPELPRRPDSLDLAAALQTLATTDEPDSLWRAVEPRQREYRRLIELLAIDRALLEDSLRLRPPVLPPALLRPGDALPDAAGLRTWLRFLGEWPDSAAADTGTSYDAALVQAVRRFQKHQALLSDGIVGPETRTRLLVPAAERVRQIELNLERWRWLPRPAGTTTIEVNIPAFQLRIVDPAAVRGDSAPTMDVILGASPRFETPLLLTLVTGIRVRPAWTVPRSIAREEIRPRMRRDTTVPAREGFELLVGDSIVPPTRANIRRIGVSVDLRQRPGPGNPLGLLKLEMSNPANVYLHDTPGRSLFARPERALSHGCVRLADAEGLARWLLSRNRPGASPTLAEALAADTTLVIPLVRPVPVLIVYATVETDTRGVPTFYFDVYGADRRLDAALREARPAMGVRKTPE